MQILLCDQYDQSTQVIEVAQGVEPNQIITPDRNKSEKERTWILESAQRSGCVERYQIIDVFTAPAHHKSLQNACFRQVVVAKRLIGEYAS
ncbi:MAG TPA: hypothetical protein V6C65_37835 [Allocoleopsis sp.]